MNGYALRFYILYLILSVERVQEHVLRAVYRSKSEMYEETPNPRLVTDIMQQVLQDIAILMCKKLVMGLYKVVCLGYLRWRALNTSSEIVTLGIISF